MYEGWPIEETLRAGYSRVAVQVSELEQLPLGGVLIGGLLGLRGVSMDWGTAVRVTALWDRVAAMVAAEAMIGYAEALRAADLPDSFDGYDAARLVAQELATMTHVPFSTAYGRAELVGQVARTLPVSWEALDRGQLSLPHLKALARATGGCVPRLAQLVDARIIPLAVERGWTPSELSKAALRMVIALDPDGATERAEAAKDHADVTLYPGPDQTATIVATGDAVTMRRAMDTIQARAEQLRRDGDPRPIGPRRLTALADYVLGHQPGQPGQPGGPVRPVVEAVITVDLSTVLGLTDHPGELSGYGPISADTARQLTADATLRRLITDPITGIMIDLGTRYQPSAMLRRVVNTVHRSCRFPGCARRAIDCDCDHRTPHAAGGRTSTINLHPLCRMHHNLKTHQLWHVTLNPDGSQTWTSPLGHTYTKPAATYPIECYQPPDDDTDHDPYLSRQTDPDPPNDPDPLPLPEPPPLTDEEYQAFNDALDTLDTQRFAYATTNYDHWHNLGLIA